MRGRQSACCFTGHRPGKLPWRYNEEDLRCVSLKARIADAVEAAYQEGFRHFLCGMALGCDLYFCECVLRLRQMHPDVTVEAAVPCPSQADAWPPDQRRRYERLVAACDFETLVSACGEIGQGNFSVRVEIPPDAELGYLTNSFNQMAGQVEHLINTVYLKDIAERDLELQMLRNQINPHFLYNTLESMRMAAYTEGAHDISQMCLLLADVLRYGVSSPTELVTLQEEIEHLKEYITLQQYRFHYAVKINVMVSQDLYEFLSLKLMFQPLVENALNHGFEGFTGNERIGIFGYQKEGILYFQVTDNGVGMAPEQVEALNGYIRGENEAFTSIGLKNVHRRIELYYGIGYGLTIESQEGRGTSVCIKIPLTSAK